MPFNIKFENPPAGTIADVSEDGRKVQVTISEFLSSEDGMVFIERLEALPSEIVRMLPSAANIRCSQIDHLLCHFDTDGSATVYCNELAQTGIARIRDDIEKGQLVYEDDIVDIEQFIYNGVEIPNNHGVLVVFSKGWRKGIYYDFAPTQGDRSPRDYNIWDALGQCYNYLCFQNVHSISEDAWIRLFNDKWFPFIGLSRSTIRELLTLAELGKP